jgi:hypothetical protein
MNPPKFLTAALIIIVISGTLNGCKKNNDKIAACELSSIIPVPAGSPYYFSYNSENKLIRVIQGNTTLTFDYTDHTITTTSLDSGKFFSKTIATLNADGLALNVRVSYDVTDSTWYNTVYEYNGVELSRSIATSSTSDSPVVSTYAWSDQNMITITSGSTTTVLDYYTDKPRQGGDLLYLIQILQGYEIYRTKNLIKYISGTNLVYEFGPEGRINSVTSSTANMSSILSYQYQCN